MRSFRTSTRFLNFSPKKHLGIIILIFILLFLLCLRYALPFLVSHPDDSREEQLAKDWQSYILTNSDSGSRQMVTVVGIKDSNKKIAERFPFNPNTISKENLIRLGLPTRTVYTWIHYREKGGHFYKTTDLKKLYTLSDKDYEQIAPYVQLPGGEKEKHFGASPKNHHYQSKITIIPLNEADTILLKRLPGIGSVLAGRIVAFRKALGGFYDVSQLREVYHLPDSVYEKNKSRFKINTTLIQQININNANYKTLTRHPYLRPYAGAILKLRKKTGKFTDISQIRQISLINEQKYRKIAPYLTL